MNWYPWPWHAPLIVVSLCLVAGIVGYLTHRPQPTADQRFGCTVSQQVGDECP